MAFKSAFGRLVFLLQTGSFFVPRGQPSRSGPRTAFSVYKFAYIFLYQKKKKKKRNVLSLCENEWITNNAPYEGFFYFLFSVQLLKSVSITLHGQFTTHVRYMLH